MRAIYCSTVALCHLLILPSCLGAISTRWNAVGCASAAVPGGNNVDDLYDTAVDMANYAVLKLSTVIDADKFRPKSDETRAANNAKWLWGVNFKIAKKILGLWVGDPLDSASKTRLRSVQSVFSQIVQQMTTTHPDGYIFCTGQSLQRGDPTNEHFPFDAWYYTDPNNGRHVIFEEHLTGGRQPCTDGVGATLGETYSVVLANGNTLGSRVTAVVLCTNQWPSSMLGKPGAKDADIGEGSNPETVKSMAGTILHEMVHTLDPTIYLDQVDASIPDGKQARGFDRCTLLAQANAGKALVNPDNYRVFAEMNYLSRTRWGAPAPPGGNGLGRRTEGLLDTIEIGVLEQLFNETLIGEGGKE